MVRMRPRESPPPQPSLLRKIDLLKSSKQAEPRALHLGAQWEPDNFSLRS